MMVHHFCGICFDVDGKAHIGIKVVISGRRIVIDIELAVVSILDCVGHDLRRRIIARNHTPRPVDDSSRKGLTEVMIRIRFPRKDYRIWITE